MGGRGAGRAGNVSRVRSRAGKWVNAPLVLLGLALAVGLHEGAVRLLMVRPSLLRLLPQAVTFYIHDIYMQCDRPVVHLQEANARYDPELFYTLRPGTFTYRTFEDQNFQRELERQLATRTDLPGWIRGMKLVRVNDRPAMPDDWVLDEHWGAQTHAYMATRLIDALDLPGGALTHSTAQPPGTEVLR